MPTAHKNCARTVPQLCQKLPSQHFHEPHGCVGWVICGTFSFRITVYQTCLVSHPPRTQILEQCHCHLILLYDSGEYATVQHGSNEQPSQSISCWSLACRVPKRSVRPLHWRRELSEANIWHLMAFSITHPLV